MESDSEQFGLRIRRKRTVLAYAAVCLLALGIGVIVAVQWLTRPTEALMPTMSSGQVKVDQANYRLYQSSSSATPGAQLAADNTAATLPQTGASFRVRVGVENKEDLMLAKHIIGGFGYVCAVALDGRVYCWGSNSNGKIGSGNTSSALVPSAVKISGALVGKVIKQIEPSSAGNHSCVIASDDKAYCWGHNGFGQLGNNNTVNSLTPVAVDTAGVLASKTIKQIASGGISSCVIASDDKAYCWGSNNFGQLGNGNLKNSSTPTPVSTTGVLAGKTIKQITAGNSYFCVIASDDKAYCWGGGRRGALGNGSTLSLVISTPTPVSTTGVLAGKTIKQITAGTEFTCAIASDDKAYCWGSNSSGQLGNNSTINSGVPVAVNTSGVLAGKTIKQISAGSSHTCAIASDDKAYCWGSNSSGQLGNNSTINSGVPTHVYAPKENTTIPANTMKLRTQYAKKTAATCQAVAAGWQDVTNNSTLAYSAAGPNNGTAIAAMANNPGLPPTSVGHSYQSIVRPGSAAQLTFTNNRDINSGETGLWDLALTDNGLERNTSYCIRLAADTAAAPGTSIDTYSQYPEFKTAGGSLDIRFADATDTTLTNPTTVFSAAMTGKTASTTTAKLSNNSSQQLEVANSLSTTGWSVSLAATGGSTAKWTQTGDAANYAFNSTNTDQGQLSVDLSSSAFTASGSTPLGQACTTAGLSYGAGGAFVAGTASANAITLVTASSSSGLTCLFKLQDISLKQTIPAYQKPGTYTLPVTVTVVAQ